MEKLNMRIQRNNNLNDVYFVAMVAITTKSAGATK